MAKKNRTIVGSPLTPEMLFQLGEMPDYSPDEKSFDRTKEWINHYRIWTCHGYRESGNLNVGFLRLQRGVTGPDKRFELQIHQELKNEGGTYNRVLAKIDCLDADLSCPVKWDYTSVIQDDDGKEDKSLTVNIKGEISGGKIKWVRNGIPSEMICDGHPSCDWCVYETIQRRAKQFAGNMTFDMLEGLERFKSGQQLSDRGKTNIKIADSTRRFHRIDQVGTGILPFEYWIDESSRLCLMSSMNKVYILDTQKKKEYTQRKGT